MSSETLADARHLSTHDKQKLRQNEKYEKNYRQWQQAKVETKQDHYKHLKEKVALQHDLIRAQDEFALQKREKEQQCIFQKRQARKASKHAREEALLNICRQSLDDDRRTSQTGRVSHASTRSRRTPGGVLPVDVPRSPSPGAGELSSSATLVTEQLKGRGILEPGVVYRRRTLSPFVGEDDEDDRSDLPVQARRDSLPWHHAQLYRLYGDKADYFLYPKIEPKPQKQLHPKLRNPGGGGAEVLWAGLRNESVSRLRRYDRNVSKELKSAFSAFVRQSLSKNKMLVKRNYCPTDDVPDLPRLLDQSLLHRACSLRHKVQLMHRSSITNADRTRVLTYNNPFPELNNLDGEDSIERYLPSWMDSDAELLEPEYQKWVESRLQEGELLGTELGSDHAAIRSEQTPVPSRKKAEYPKLKFLKFEDDRDILADAHKTRTADHPADSNVQQEPPTLEKLTEELEKESLHDYSDKEPLVSTPKMSSFTTQWEPLSMNALVEYTQKVDAVGQGVFQHGQTKMWQAPVTT